MKKLWNRIANIFSVIAVCVIAGCSYAGDGGNNNPPPVLPAAPVKYTITYDAAGHGTAPEAKTVEKGYKLTDEDLQVLTADGFDFGGWKFNEKIAAAGEDVVSDMTLVAVWTEWGTVASPTFSTAAGEVDKGTKVSITSTTEGAVIFYTTDGSVPTAGSTKYESEIEITAATTIKAFAVKSGLKDSDVVSASYTVDVTPPSPVTNLTSKSTASQTVKLTWTNPSDADFAKVVITYDTDKKVEVLKTATPNNEATVTALTNGTEYTFTVKAYDNEGNASSGVDVKCKLGKSYTPAANSKGGLEGYSNQTQGEIVKETWIADNGNLKINGTEIVKTSEVVVIPTGTVATVTMPDDSSWSSYYSDSHRDYKGVFIKDRNVKLDPFVMSQYLVTQKLYYEVMGNNPSSFSSNPASGETQENRPVEKVTWCQACAFCNELTKKTMTESDCVYYSDKALTAPYTATDTVYYKIPYIAYDMTTKKWTKKGYRLPTEAEWEFAARGGDPNAKEWSYAYAGSQTKKEPSKFEDMPSDDELENYAWYSNNSNKKTHEVGLKKKNTLNLYDMSGNVDEWCYDWYNYTAGSRDRTYTVDDYVQNPVGAGDLGSNFRCYRGGSYGNYACYCAVSYRGNIEPSTSYDYIGFRVCRSSSN